MTPTAPLTSPRPFPVGRDGVPLPQEIRGGVLAVGNFDGVHRGHQRLIEAARATGARIGAPAAVLTFEPHPRAVFRPGEPLFRLTPEPVKLLVLRRLGLDGALVRRFDREFSGLSARDFVEGFLARELGARGVVVGHDFRFGRGREGSPEVLRALADELGLACAVVEPVREEGGEVVSSSAIRAALSRGEVAEANRLLGYRWFVRGEVIHGRKQGRELGYPTANIDLGEASGLAHGIYAVRAALLDGRVVGGVASYGRRPTFDDGAPLFEPHLFDFAGDLYGQEIEVEIVGFLRGEERFDGVEALIRQMERDAEEARAVLAREGTRSLIGVG